MQDTERSITPSEGSEKSPFTRRFLLASIETDWLIEAQLLLLTFGTGIQDAISFPDFHCFASNQTGNTVILAVGLAGLDGGLFDIANIGVSLAAFVAGALLTGQIAHKLGPRRRSWLFVTHIIQTLMTFGAAVIQAVDGVNQRGASALGALLLLAFSSGAQVASMRPFRVQEITTAMATAAWVDFVIDPQLLARNNRSRSRRVLFLVALMLGSFAGAFAHPVIGSSGTIVVSGAAKLLVTVSLLFNRSERDESLSTSSAVV